ncbi:KamA family radical SAM protein [Thermomonas sp. S9]|nr:KamA family radical SAM protein [Thermomonas sp. S9]
MQQPPAPRWQMLWREAVRDPRELLTLLGLDALASSLSEAAARQFRCAFRAASWPGCAPATRTTRCCARCCRCWTRSAWCPASDWTRWAILARRGGGVIHKYNGRALLIATGSCAVHCRYCFRRHYPYAGDTAAAAGWRDAVALVAADPSLHEVILSGGDPLSLADHKLMALTDALRAIPHIRRLRLHTRLPVVLPERVDAGLLAWLGGLPWPVVVVLHANHANEFDPAVDAALARLRAAGASLLNQAVLLRGVNDDVEALAELCERGFAAGVLPYYLHQLDRVAGAAHFEVDDAHALALHAALAARLPGYLVPRLVREIAGQPGKTPLTGL